MSEDFTLCLGCNQPIERCLCTPEVLDEEPYDPPVSALLEWLRSRPGASWVATISDVENALSAMQAK